MKKGFTLIELLAVIVILAVTALISVPLILGVIENSKEGAFKDSVSLTFSSAELYETKNTISESGIEVKDLVMKNNNFKYGKIIKNSSNELVAVNVSDGRYCANGSLTNLLINKGECDSDTPSCTYSVIDGDLGLNNYYITSPTIEFTSSQAKSSGLYYGVGYTENYESLILNSGEIKTQTSVITANTDGVTINGYVKSGAGKKSTCSVDLKIDTNNPTVTISVSGKDATITLGDNLGINGFAITTSATVPTTWTSSTGTSKVELYTASTAGTYYAWVRDQAGNVAYSSFVIDVTAFCPYAIGSQFTYNYTGGVQSFSVLCSGTYKLEVWGAQGGGATGTSGYVAGFLGGYTKGYQHFNKDTTLYVVIGGKGNDHSYTGGSAPIAILGGYNGGGSGRTAWNMNNQSGASGGGATHIALSTGLLSAVPTDKVLLVAGGAGGQGVSYSGTLAVNSVTELGGTGAGGGTSAKTNIYGIGASTSLSTAASGDGAGGGGGYLGGSFGHYSYSAYGGTGSIIGVTNYETDSAITTSGIRSGNGYATITLVTLN